MVSNCSEYYSFENFNIIKHDIYGPDFDKIKNQMDNIFPIFVEFLYAPWQGRKFYLIGVDTGSYKLV